MRTQCTGTTLKKSQCKLLAIEGEKYCRYHIEQGKPPPTSTKPQQELGFIYIYTYVSLHENVIAGRKQRKEISWLVTDESKIDSNDKKQALIAQDNDQFNPWKYKGDEVLIKIGMTRRKDVTTRINEWTKQCKRDIILVTPTIAHQWTKSTKKINNPKTSNLLDSLLNRIKNLTISTSTPTGTSSSTSNGAAALGGVATCFSENGFRCKNPDHVEQKIHQWLWKEYGKGNILCEACQKTHREWAKVPAGQMDYIVQTIDRVCSNSFRPDPLEKV
ncbi:unnamed protein product [Kluyveromyces dobzhanskii CBS 2104]|uniref:WGS project CCBQ000000000 data, contig 00015 n=1 Tax=Kluyveromyces dobzhanskii CBS 2104 TaxID=1427455 RepID=A0A0A8LBR7_9SACH|nr:unnamed protein product [Kluyveromyces dobzhanskii CBS 2104]